MSTQSTTIPGVETLGVQELIDRLKSDGVSRGQSEAEALIAEARKQSMEILDAAKQEADQILTKALQEAKQIEDNGREALKLAARDATLKLKDSFRIEFQKRFGKLVSYTLKDDEFLRRLILEIAGKAIPKDQSQTMEILVPESAVASTDGHGHTMQQSYSTAEGTLSHFVLGLSADQLREGITFGATDSFSQGVRVRLLEKEVEIDLSDETVSTLLLRFLAPRFRALLDANK